MMDEDARNRIVDLVRRATLAFYDESDRAEMRASIDVDYLSRAGTGHTVMVFAPAHEYENERPVWAEIGDLTVDLDPEKVGFSSYHVHVDVTESTEDEGGFEWSDT